jgi:hypothetical protein
VQKVKLSYLNVHLYPFIKFLNIPHGTVFHGLIITL